MYGLGACPSGYTLKTGQIGVATPTANGGITTVEQPTYNCETPSGDIYNLDCSKTFNPKVAAIIGGGLLGVAVLPGWTKILAVGAAGVLFLLESLAESAYPQTDANGNTTCVWGPTSW